MQRSDSTPGTLKYGGPQRVLRTSGLDLAKGAAKSKVMRTSGLDLLKGAEKYATKGYSRVVSAGKYIGRVETERNKYMKVQGALARSGVKKHAHDIAASSIAAEKRKMPRT